jgi:hypothetical protein
MTLPRASGLSNLKEYYVSAAGIQALASSANRRQAGDGEKVRILVHGCPEIADDLANRGPHPRVGVLDVRLLFGIGPQVEKLHRSLDRLARLVLPDVVQFPVALLDRPNLAALSRVEEAFPVRSGLPALEEGELIHAVDGAVLRHFDADRVRERREQVGVVHDLVGGEELNLSATASSGMP